MENAIQTKRLTKTYSISKKQKKLNGIKSSKIVAVNDISLAVKKGEAFGLIGPNGAGKTTFLRLLSTLILPDRGEMFVLGKAVLGREDFVKRNICFITNELKLEEYFTPNFMFDYFSKLYGIDKEEAFKRKKKLFERFGINNFAETKISHLSTGMKQKVSIVISLVNDPKILIYDEPTNGLDIVTSKLVVDYLIEEKQAGKTIILSTHIFEIIEKVCDRIGIMINGNLVLTSYLDEITKDATLEQVFFKAYNGFGVKNEI